MADKTVWIGVDWGTSNLRAWGIGARGETRFSAASPKGMGRLAPDAYPDVLRETVVSAGFTPDGPVEVLVCGMAGARQGWIEAPYLEAPADLRGLRAGAIAAPAAGGPFSVSILPGVCQKKPGAENVMRGEETQLLGLTTIMPGYSGPVCMPGTHSKWARMEGARLVSFSTAMTGELYEVMREHSVLRHSLGDDGEEAGEDGFEAGLATGLESPELLSSTLFTVRAAALLSGRGPGWCGGYLSGLLIGTEIGGKSDWIGKAALPLIGSPGLCARYARAIDLAGGTSRTIAGEEATLAGLRAARGQAPL